MDREPLQCNMDLPKPAGREHIPHVLTIAGSDSGGGAGIQQDIRVFTTLGVYASSVITALTAQNSLGVHAVEPVDPLFIEKQLLAVMQDMSPDFVKTGMLLNAPAVLAVSRVLRLFPEISLVTDTVMLSKNGAVLLDDHGIEIMCKKLFPMALLITPNIPEAEKLLSVEIRDVNDMQEAARKLAVLAEGHASVLLKGGHLPGEETVDVLFHKGEFSFYGSKRINTIHTHGTGCTLSSAITALLAHGFPMKVACGRAIEYTRYAIRNAFPLGRGTGPLNIFAISGRNLC